MRNSARQYVVYITEIGENNFLVEPGMLVYVEY